MYDLQNDPAETLNIIGNDPERVEEIERTIEAWLEANLRKRERIGLDATPGVIQDQESIERLRSLGYVQAH
jgi:hypothetical protein